jgi:molybdopterin-guanine dinucleotide biosynthesis protein A
MKKIILTGGTSKRFGSDKSEALINGSTLLEIITKDLGELIVVGPEGAVQAIYVQEEPLHSGPVAAIAAGLKEVDTDLVAIFATDMPFAPKILPQLESAINNDAALPIDCDGIPQPLAGLYKTEALRAALNTFENIENRSVKSLIEKLVVDRVPLVDTEFLLDIDTQDDLLKAVEIASRLAL